MSGRPSGQRRYERGWKLYSLHAAEVEGIGKAHRPYEFGVKSLPLRRLGSRSPPPTAARRAASSWLEPPERNGDVAGVAGTAETT